MFMSKDFITLQFEQFHHQFELTHYFDTSLCYDEVKEYSSMFWQGSVKKHAQSNYEFDNDVDWSLGNMLKKKSFDLGYTILKKDNHFLAASGIRRHTDTEAIVLSRFFAAKTLLPYANAIMLPYQLEIAQKNLFTSAIITFNDYNKHLAKYYDEILPQKKDEVSQKAFLVLKEFKLEGKKIINATEQTVFRTMLKN